jgi:hypothetical protein
MNFLRLSLFVVFAVVLASCNKDDDDAPSCAQSDWVGTYTGTADCDGDSDPATVTITAIGEDMIRIVYSTGNVTTTFDPLPVDGCNIERTNSAGGITGSVSATLDGDQFSLTETLTGGGFNTNCMVEATRD